MSHAPRAGGVEIAAEAERQRAADAGFAPDLGEKLDAGIRAGLLRDIHAVVVSRGDAIVLERGAGAEPVVDTIAFAPEPPLRRELAVAEVEYRQRPEGERDRLERLARRWMGA